MTRNLADDLHRLAHSGPGADAARPGGMIADHAPQLVRQVQRRRTARHAGTSVVGAAAVAALAVGGNAFVSRTPTTRGPGTASGPGTELSRRAGAECGKPFDGTGKSDLRFKTETFGLNPDTETTLRITAQTLELDRPEAKLPLEGPSTLVVLDGGEVVGIVETPTNWQKENPGAEPDATQNGDERYFAIPFAALTNCTGVEPTAITDGMFTWILLTQIHLDGEEQPALVIAPPAKGPRLQGTTAPSPEDAAAAGAETAALARTWLNIVVGETVSTEGTVVGIEVSEYLAVKDTPGAGVPLHQGDEASNDLRLYSGPAEAHVSDTGTLVVTYDGAKEYELAQGAGGTLAPIAP